MDKKFGFIHGVVIDLEESCQFMQLTEENLLDVMKWVASKGEEIEFTVEKDSGELVGIIDGSISGDGLVGVGGYIFYDTKTVEDNQSHFTLYADENWAERWENNLKLFKKFQSEMKVE